MTNKEQTRIFSKNLNYQISLTHKSQKEICDALEISTSSMNNWCKGNSIPRMGTVQILADYFHIGKSDLLEDMESLSKEKQQGKEDAQLLMLIRQLTPSNKEVLKSTLLALLSAQEPR